MTVKTFEGGTGRTPEGKKGARGVQLPTEVSPRVGRKDGSSVGWTMDYSMD